MSLEVAFSKRARSRISETLPNLVENKIASRIAAKDSSIWGDSAASEASIRLNWLHAHETVAEQLAALTRVRQDFVAQGITRIVLGGMGGSSLAPEVIASSLGLPVIALDATSPSQVRSALADIAHTAVVVSSKSGSTVETDSHRRIFEAEFIAAGIDPTERIVIVTDPGSPFAAFAQKAGYRYFTADPNVGGRFSALTAFGIVPTVLAGANPARLLDSAAKLLPALSNDSDKNPALLLASAITSNPSVQNKLLLVSDPETDIGLADWIEQLIAESTGKEGTGLLPVILSPDAPELYRLPLDAQLIWLGSQSAAKKYALNPDVAITGDLGEIFLLWEYATAISGYILGINPFDQPNVESAKQATRQLLDQEFSALHPVEIAPGIAIRGTRLLAEATDLAAAISNLLAAAKPDSYFAIHAYLDRVNNPEFAKLRNLLAKATGRPTTFGWGPRFLHSTGQFHKGGQPQGIFLQLVDTVSEDLQIPDRPFSFGQLLQAQADGDANVLADHQLPVLSLEITNPDLAFETLTKLLNQQISKAN